MTFDDPEHAFLFVGAGRRGECGAWIERQTGRVFLASELAGVDPEVEAVPDDVDDAELYAEVPHPHDLDLGRALPIASSQTGTIVRCLKQRTPAFRNRGGWRRFKDLLHRHDLLDA